MNDHLTEDWKKVEEFIEKEFGSDIDIRGILFLIGVQELGKGYVKFTKDQKVEVIHVAICTLLSQYNYYEFEGNDEEGWPHYKETKKLPLLKPGEQLKVMKEAIVDYFKANGNISANSL
ncbi:MAG: hypothetical protein ACO3E1_05045 [Flavobacteriales bacterium]